MTRLPTRSSYGFLAARNPLPCRLCNEAAEVLHHSHVRGFSLVELIVGLAVVSLLMALLLPAILYAREAARRVECGNNLKQLGLALEAYHNHSQSLPPGVTADEDGYLVYANATTLLLPYLELDALARTYDLSEPWAAQRPSVARTPIPTLQCPSTSTDLITIRVLAASELPVGRTFATTDYLYSKGSFDSWCLLEDRRHSPHRGVFDMNRSTAFVEIRDGRSSTFAMGEGAGGLHWPLCHGAGCTTPYVGKFGLIPASNAWLIGSPGNAYLKSLGFITGSTWGSSAGPLNKTPVTDTYADWTALDDCRTSFEGGPHTVANFRSDHRRGAYFLFADGAVHFLSERIDLSTYRDLSTMAQGTPAEIP